MNNPYEPNEYLVVEKRGFNNWLFAFCLFVSSAIAVGVHFTVMKMHYNLVFSREVFNSMSVAMMIIAVPPLAFLGDSGLRGLARAICIFAGASLPVIGLAERGEMVFHRLSGPFGWALLWRFTLCSAAPFLLLSARINERLLFRRLVMLAIVLGYLQSIAVENPILSRYYTGWPHQ
ncbi:MAG: hypothetical protein AAF394_07040 [Planctomycetota bacterium]